jgi:cyclophilin family peptidyl-prolyl cis-trans isomerase
MAQHRATSGLTSFFGFRGWFGFRRPTALRNPRTLLHLEELEDRSVPAAPLGMISGTAFIDAMNMGMMFPGEPTLPGVPVMLTGMTTTGTMVQASETTDSAGGFTFNNVPAGQYQVTAGPVAGVAGGSLPFTVPGGASGTAFSGNFVVQFGGNTTQNLGFQGLGAGSVTVRQFLSSTTSADFADLSGIAGSGFASATTPPADIIPFITIPISDVSVAMNNAGTRIDLARNFSSPDISTSQVTFNTSDGPMHVTLFDAQAPQTVANFYDYINSGAYNNTIFHRLQPGFVLQGGGTTLGTNSSGTTLTPITKGPPVANEFGIPNTAGTLALAQVGTSSGTDPNSGTDEFFFNLVDNPGLDAQQFAVFGAIADSPSQTVLNTLSSVPSSQIHDESGSPAAAANPGVNLGMVPLPGYTGTNFPSDATASNFLVINSIHIDSRPDFLTYSVVGNSNPGLVTTVITNENLNLFYTPNMTGSAIITVRATNQLGNSVDDTFMVTVHP